jgi:hypothetical protein
LPRHAERILADVEGHDRAGGKRLIDHPLADFRPPLQIDCAASVVNVVNIDPALSRGEHCG